MALIGDTSDLDVLQYGGKPVLPEKDSYSVITPNGAVTSNVAGGLPKSQLQYFNSPYEVNVTYVSLSGAKAAFLEDFFALHNGQSFIASLLISTAGIEQFVVKYLGKTTHSKTGFNGSMSVKLLVEPAIDRCFQKSMQDLLPCMGDDACKIFDLTNQAIRARA